MVFGRTASKVDPSKRDEIRQQIKKYGTKKAGLDQQIAQDQAQDNAPLNTEQDIMGSFDLAQKISDRLKQGAGPARQEGQDYAEKLFSKETQGLTPQQRQNLQEQANRQISRDFQSYNRQLIGKQGQRGVRGGAAFAQQAELARLAGDAQQEFQRDLSNLDADTALKKLAAIFNVGQGYASDELLRMQQAQDLISGHENKRRNKDIENKFTRYFERI